MDSAQLTALIVTSIVTLAGTLLAYLITRQFLLNKKKSFLLWSAGLWVFVLTAFFEVLFALNVYSSFLMSLYLFLVVVVVQLLSLGSIELVSSQLLKRYYYAFSILAALFVLYSVLTSSTANLIKEYVVLGMPPLSVIIASSIATFPSAIVIMGVAAKTYLKTKSVKMLSIILGILVISIAGTLYIVQMPSFLYLAELLGAFLLFFGFYTPTKAK